MATVSDLINHTMRVSSLTTSNASETALVLGWLNDAYQRAVGRTGASTRTIPISPANNVSVLVRATYQPSDADFNTVKGVFVGVSSDQGRKLTEVGMPEIDRLRASSTTVSTQGPVYFSARGNGDIELWPVTAGSAPITIEVEMQPPVLVVSAPGTGQESTPRSIPPMFHYDVLAGYAIARAHEYRGLTDKATYFRGQHEGGLKELDEWLNDQGGIMGPEVLLIRERSGVGVQRDQNW